MMTIFNMGYLILLYFLMILTGSIKNGNLELSITIITIVITFIIYFKLVNILVNKIESRLLRKLKINTNNQSKLLTKNKKVSLITYIGHTYLMLFVVDDNNNLLYKIRMKGNLFQRYDILDLTNKRIGFVIKLGSNFYTKLFENRTNIFIQKFFGRITLLFNTIPVKIKANDDYTKIEFHSAEEWKDIISKLSFKGEARVLTTKINFSERYQIETILFAIAYVTRFYYPGNN